MPVYTYTTLDDPSAVGATHAQPFVPLALLPSGAPSHVSRSRIFDLAMKTVVFLRRARISKHHHGVTRCRH